MKLTYWIADHQTDSRAHSMRSKTRKGCTKLVNESDRPVDFSLPRKVEVIYRDAFDLVLACTEEGSDK